MTEATAAERYEAVIGIEVHCQLRTASKMFCGCATDYGGAPPNSHVCPVCLGLPGALPTINRRAVEHVLTTGAAIEATAPAATRWDRKNYFYPDLPKGYQISQYDLPLASLGRLTFDTSDGPFTVDDHPRTPRGGHRQAGPCDRRGGPQGQPRRLQPVRVRRSWRSSTEPDIRTAEQARRYAEELQLLLRSIGASDADMERGQLRVEANVSLRPRGTEPFGTRVEVKNMNSFRAVERAIEFEIERQAVALDAGEPLSRRRAAGPRSAARRTGCGSRRPPTTTATSRSRTCRRCTSTRPGWRRSRRACRSCRAHAALAIGMPSG